MTQQPSQLPTGAAAYDYISKKWGGIKTRPLIVAVTLSTIPQRILQNSPRRMFWILTNTSTQNLYVGFDPTVGSTTGILIPPLGGSASMSVDEDGEAVTNEIWLSFAGGVLIVWGFEVIQV